jgi:DNA-binding PadR family transcriptional regulator
MLSTGTLFGALRWLLESKWIERLEEEETARDRQAFRLTPAGRSHLRMEMARMKELARWASLRMARKEA